MLVALLAVLYEPEGDLRLGVIRTLMDRVSAPDVPAAGGRSVSEPWHLSTRYRATRYAAIKVDIPAERGV